jgi:glutathione peroxidase
MLNLNNLIRQWAEEALPCGSYQLILKCFPILILILFTITMNANTQKYKTLHDFKVVSIDGEIYDLSQHKGQKVLIVNTASKCGLTPQYKDMEALYRTYGGEKFVIIGFPSNNFMRQEPGTNEQIKEFCSLKYDVTFPMMAKISVKGRDQHPLYSWLTRKKENGVMNAKVIWNFQKFMIDEDGRLVGMIPPQVKPDTEKIIKWLNEDK